MRGLDTPSRAHTLKGNIMGKSNHPSGCTCMQCDDFESNFEPNFETSAGDQPTELKVMTYSVATHFMPALINGDYTGLTDEEEQHLADFDFGLLPIPTYHFATDDVQPEFCRCEISGLHAMCVNLHVVYRNN